MSDPLWFLAGVIFAGCITVVVLIYGALRDGARREAQWNPYPDGCPMLHIPVEDASEAADLLIEVSRYD